MFCIKCGNDIGSENFCSKCGTPAGGMINMGTPAGGMPDNVVPTVEVAPRVEAPSMVGVADKEPATTGQKVFYYVFKSLTAGIPATILFLLLFTRSVHIVDRDMLITAKLLNAPTSYNIFEICLDMLKTGDDAGWPAIMFVSGLCFSLAAGIYLGIRYNKITSLARAGILQSIVVFIFGWILMSLVISVTESNGMLSIGLIIFGAISCIMFFVDIIVAVLAKAGVIRNQIK